MAKALINLKINDITNISGRRYHYIRSCKKIKYQNTYLVRPPRLSVAGNCRVCVVEVKGARYLQAACATPVAEGMEIFTNSQTVRQSRKHVIELLLSEHNADCTSCTRNGKCELQDLAAEYHIFDRIFLDLLDPEKMIADISSPAIKKDMSKCIHCQRCVRTCEELQYVSALAVIGKGAEQHIGTFLIIH
jgi:NADH dehydrogenase/NADH:ubiquinone oxidoreductase subunit G